MDQPRHEHKTEFSTAKLKIYHPKWKLLEYISLYIEQIHKEIMIRNSHLDCDIDVKVT